MKKRIIIYLLIFFSVFFVKDVKAITCEYDVGSGKLGINLDTGEFIETDTGYKFDKNAAITFKGVKSCPTTIYGIEKESKHYSSITSTSKAPGDSGLIIRLLGKIVIKNDEILKQCIYKENDYTVTLRQSESNKYTFNVSFPKENINREYNSDSIKTGRKTYNPESKEFNDLMNSGKCPEYIYLNKDAGDIYFSKYNDLTMGMFGDLPGGDYLLVQSQDGAYDTLPDSEKDKIDKEKKRCEEFYKENDSNSLVEKLKAKKKLVDDLQSTFLKTCYLSDKLSCSNQELTYFVKVINENRNEYYELLKEADGKYLDITCFNATDILKTLKNEFDSSISIMDGRLISIKNELESSLELSENYKDALNEINTFLDVSGKNKENNFEFGKTTKFYSCEEIIGTEGVEFFNKIFGYVKILAPILLILFGTLDFGKAVLMDDKDALSKATKKFILRAIAVVVIFFIPLIVNVIFSLVNNLGMTGDLSCGIK